MQTQREQNIDRLNRREQNIDINQKGVEYRKDKEGVEY